MQRKNAKSATVTLTIHSKTAPVRLDGITVTETRPGWITIEVPPLEQWSKPMLWLSRPQRERIEEADFYRWLQNVLAERYARLGA